MGRPKGSKNKNHTYITYPRKCEYCDYISNNPAMYHFHKQTHDPIPENQLCDHGCGKEAKYRGTGGKYTCEKIAQHCPEYINRQRERAKNQWEGNDERRAAARKTFVATVFAPEIRQKTLDAIKARSKIKFEEAKDYRSYARICRRRGQQWAKENGYELGQQTYHVDHIFSVLDAYNAKLDLDVVNHPANLRILSAIENIKKHDKSEITFEQLQERIEYYENTL